MIVIFKPTYSCNFACRYCYLSDETTTPYRAELELVLKALFQVKDIMNPHDKRGTTLIWHGGEPLLWGYDNIKKVLEFTEDNFNGYNYRHTIQTNLSLVDERFIDLFKKHKVNVSFSLDGTKDIHDSQRVDKDGHPTFEKIISKYSLCKAHGINPGCIVVVTKNILAELRNCMNLWQVMG